MNPRAAAATLRGQHREGADLAPLGAETPTDLDEAYAVQDAVHDLADDRVAGWKIALTTKVMQEFVGIAHPLAGAILTSHEGYSQRVEQGTLKRNRQKFRGVAI